MTKRSLLRLTALVLALSYSAAPAAGLKVRGNERVPQYFAQLVKDGVTLSQAIAKARKSFPGRLLHGETESRNGKQVHVVVIMNDDGLVKTLRYDAATGRRL